MTRKVILLSVLISQFIVSCSSSNDSVIDESLNNDVNSFITKPYSALTPAQQKVKLENEANAMFAKMDKTKTSGAIEAVQNLEYLLSISSVDILNKKNNNQISEVLNVSGVYGIYTWNSVQKIWIKTPSTTDLKFVFPAKKTATTNNATLSSNSIASDVKIDVIDTYERGSWQYNQNTGNSSYVITSPAIYDQMFLPSSVNATLSIDNVQAATFAANAKYSGGNKTPDESGFKMVLNDGYVWENNGKKAQPNIVNSSFKYNGANLIKFTVNSTANIDALLSENGPALNQYQGKANGLVEIMDNFLLVADMNLEVMANDQDILNSSLAYPDYGKKSYFTDLNTYCKNKSLSEVAAYNKNIKMALVSKQDGTKLADVIQVSEKAYSYVSYNVWVVDASSQNGGYWRWDSNTSGTLIQNYDNVLYLRFNDSTLVAMEVYFSSGFTNVETKFQNFINAFNR